MLTNKPTSFLRSAIIETVLPDFDKMTLAKMKTHFVKRILNIVENSDCGFKKFSSVLFRRDPRKLKT